MLLVDEDPTDEGIAAALHTIAPRPSGCGHRFVEVSKPRSRNDPAPGAEPVLDAQGEAVLLALA